MRRQTHPSEGEKGWRRRLGDYVHGLTPGEGFPGEELAALGEQIEVGDTFRHEHRVHAVAGQLRQHLVAVTAKQRVAAPAALRQLQQDSGLPNADSRRGQRPASP